VAFVLAVPKAGIAQDTSLVFLARPADPHDVIPSKRVLAHLQAKREKNNVTQNYSIKTRMHQSKAACYDLSRASQLESFELLVSCFRTIGFR
jgi:hypothetical protein